MKITNVHTKTPKMQLDQRLKEKFKDKFQRSADKMQDKLELSKKAAPKPLEGETQKSKAQLDREQLKELVKSGGFHFNNKESAVLREILDV